MNEERIGDTDLIVYCDLNFRRQVVTPRSSGRGRDVGCYWTTDLYGGVTVPSEEMPTQDSAASAFLRFHQTTSRGRNGATTYANSRIGSR